MKKTKALNKLEYTVFYNLIDVRTIFFNKTNSNLDNILKNITFFKVL